MKPEDRKIFKQTEFKPIEGNPPEKTAYEWEQEFIELVGIKSMNKVSAWEEHALKIFDEWQKKKVAQAKKDFKKKYPNCDIKNILDFSDIKQIKEGAYTVKIKCSKKEYDEYLSIVNEEKYLKWRNYPLEDIDDVNAQDARNVLEKIEDVQRAMFTKKNNSFELPVRAIQLGLAVAQAHASGFEFDVHVGQQERKKQSNRAKKNKEKIKKAKLNYKKWQKEAGIYFKEHPTHSKNCCAKFIIDKLKLTNKISTVAKKILKP